MSDYFDRIERHLLDAVERNASRQTRGRLAAPAISRPINRYGPPRFTGVISIIGALVTIAIVGLALGLLRHSHQTRGASQIKPLSPSPQTPPQRHTSLDQLLARFAVLRRPQTQADRSWVPSGQAGSARHYARVISRYTRLATTLSDGERLFLTVEQTQVEQNGQAPGSYLLNLWVVKNGRIVGGESYSPDVGDYTSTPGPLAWLDHRETWSSIMPDGVTSVRWIFPRENGLRTHIYPRALTVDVPVVGNVAATRVARSATWDPAVVILYGAHHQPLKTFRSGNPDRVG